MEYASPFDFKAEAKKIKELSKTMPNGKQWAEKQMKDLNAHSEMLRRNSPGNGQHGTF
jgi:hypothetical protein